MLGELEHDRFRAGVKGRLCQGCAQDRGKGRPQARESRQRDHKKTAQRVRRRLGFHRSTAVVTFALGHRATARGPSGEPDRRESATSAPWAMAVPACPPAIRSSRQLPGPATTRRASATIRARPAAKRPPESGGRRGGNTPICRAGRHFVGTRRRAAPRRKLYDDHQRRCGATARDREVSSSSSAQDGRRSMSLGGTRTTVQFEDPEKHGRSHTRPGGCAPSVRRVSPSVAESDDLISSSPRVVVVGRKGSRYLPRGLGGIVPAVDR